MDDPEAATPAPPQRPYESTDQPKAPPPPHFTRATSRRFFDESAEYARVRVPLPQLNVAILVVGTHGDVLPFVSLAHALEARGHRVRIATHEVHEDLVKSHSVEYFKIAGDPREMSRWMVESGGTLVGEAWRLKPYKMEMISDIIRDLWPAVTKKGADGRPFVADAIIANPPTFGHIHVAEALSAPLHMMFPQPWLPTRSFPHPMSGLPVHAKPNALNLQSYGAIEQSLWLGKSGMINDWRRRTLDLPGLGTGLASANLLGAFRVPFSFTFSPALVPKPLDWAAHVEVVGSLRAPPCASDGKPLDESPFADLLAWLAEDPEPPIFIGFGSMVIGDPEELARIIVEAAKRSRCRCLVQSSWSKLETQHRSGGLCFDVGPAPHDWLLPKVAAVVHHGGAGTTHAGLILGKPTLVCPFFGDQFFWGEMVLRSGAGPSPCPVTKLTVEELQEKLHVLRDPETVKRAERLARRMRAEDGVATAIAHWERWLPRQNLLCDVSLLLDPPEVRAARYQLSAGWWPPGDRLRVAADVLAVCLDPRYMNGATRAWVAQGVRRHGVKPWGLVRVTGIIEGFLAGIMGCVLEVLRILFDWVGLSRRWWDEGGLQLLVCGWLLVIPIVTVGRAAHAVVILVDRTATGVYNGWARCCYGEDAHMVQVTHLVDPAQSTSHLRQVNLEGLEAELQWRREAVEREHAANAATARVKGSGRGVDPDEARVGPRVCVGTHFGDPGSQRGGGSVTGRGRAWSGAAGTRRSMRLNPGAHEGGEERAYKLLAALALARQARRIFSGPASGRERMHVAGRLALARLAKRVRAAHIGLNVAGADALAAEVESLGDFCSFTMFCILLQRTRKKFGAMSRKDADAPAESAAVSASAWTV